jgi:hypothetical protein
MFVFMFQYATGITPSVQNLAGRTEMNTLYDFFKLSHKFLYLCTILGLECRVTGCLVDRSLISLRFVSFRSPYLFYLPTIRVEVFFSLDHTQAHTTVGGTPLDEGSARRRDLYV